MNSDETIIDLLTEIRDLLKQQEAEQRAQVAAQREQVAAQREQAGQPDASRRGVAPAAHGRLSALGAGAQRTIDDPPRNGDEEPVKSSVDRPSPGGNGNRKRSIQSDVLTVGGAVLASVIASLFVTSQVFQERRIEMASKSFESYMSVVAESANKNYTNIEEEKRDIVLNNLAASRLAAKAHMAVFANKEVLHALSEFERTIVHYHLGTEIGQDNFRDLVVAMRGQIKSDKATQDLLDSVLY